MTTCKEAGQLRQHPNYIPCHTATILLHHAVYSASSSRVPRGFVSSTFEEVGFFGQIDSTRLRSISW